MGIRRDKLAAMREQRDIDGFHKETAAASKRVRSEEEKKYVKAEVLYCYETEKAYLVLDGDTKEWVPKSQLRNLAELQETEWEADQQMILELPEWLAEAKGFI